MITKRLRLEEKHNLYNTNKVEIRQLPPLLKPIDFYKSIEFFLEDVISKYYIEGKIKYALKLNLREREKVYSRGYLVFRTADKMSDFLACYKKIFLDEKG